MLDIIKKFFGEVTLDDDKDVPGETAHDVHVATCALFIENLWRIVYVDGKMNKYENHLMHKLSTLLRLSHNQLIQAKLKVLGSS